MSAASLPRIGSAALVRQNGSILIGRRDKEPNRGKWVLPGGKIEAFESVEEAAIREVKEETGLDVRVEARAGVFEIISRPNEHRLIVYSWATPVGGELNPSSDLSEIRFCPLSELDKVDLSDFVRDVLEALGVLNGTAGDSKISPSIDGIFAKDAQLATAP